VFPPDIPQPLLATAFSSFYLSVPQSWTYLEVAELLACSDDPKSSAGVSVATGRVCLIEQVEGEEPD
jgi:hypothetical protein